MRTPDGTIIYSRYRHDYVTHKDKNGKTYMLDGGLDYIRCSGNGDEELLTLYTSNKHSKIRKYLQWGTYNRNYNNDIEFVSIKDLSASHIINILNDGYGNAGYRQVMREELDWRNCEQDIQESEAEVYDRMATGKDLQDW